MRQGSYADFSSQNLVALNGNIQTPVAVLINMAEQSFKAEQAFYKQIEMPPQFCKSASETTALLKNFKTFKEYQDELCLRVFGASHEEYLFLKYFYDSNFIKALSAQSPGQDMLKTLARDLIEYYRGISETEKEDGLDLEKTGEIKAPPLPPDTDAFTTFLRDKEYSLESPGKINLKNEMRDFLINKVGLDRRSADSAVKKGPYKEVMDQVQAYINAYSNVSNSGSKSQNSTSQRGFSVLKLAQIQFVDKDHNFQHQFDKFVKNVVNFIGNQLNKSEVPDDLRQDLENQIRNEIRFTIASKGKDIVVGDTIYKSKDNKSYGKLQSVNNKEVLTLTYKELSSLAEKGTFTLDDIKLQGDSKLISTIFTPQIKNRIKEINDDYDLTFIQDGDDLIISNKRLFLDKNMFYNNMMKLKFNYAKYSTKEYAEKNTEAFKVDKEVMSGIFYDTLRDTLQNNLVVKDNMVEVIGSFDKWWAQKGHTAFMKMLDNNPTQIYEIASKSAQANVAGMLGETLMALFLQNVQIPGSVVKVLGQSDHGNGQAAVDLKIMFNDNENSLQTAGFQIKQYAASESGNKVDLYSETSLKVDSEYMRRYIEEGYLERIRSIFFDRNSSNYWLTPLNGISDPSVSEISNILNSHLMYFMRYDEAQMKNGSFNELEQNNFYVINFRFIPASSLLILAALAINDQVDIELDKRKDFFFFSESTQHIKKQNNIMSSLVRYIGLKETQEAGKKDNLCSFLQDDLRLNFIGFSINFKQQLDSVMKNAK